MTQMVPDTSFQKGFFFFTDETKAKLLNGSPRGRVICGVIDADFVKLQMTKSIFDGGSGRFSGVTSTLVRHAYPIGQFSAIKRPLTVLPVNINQRHQPGDLIRCQNYPVKS